MYMHIHLKFFRHKAFVCMDMCVHMCMYVDSAYNVFACKSVCMVCVGCVLWVVGGYKKSLLHVEYARSVRFSEPSKIKDVAIHRDF